MRYYKKSSLLIVAILSIICACDSQNASDSVNPKIARFIDFNLELSQEEVQTFNEIKEKYYYQRFSSINNTIYDSDDAFKNLDEDYANFAKQHYSSSGMRVDGINSIDDITLFKCYSSFNDVYIVSFLYKGFGIAGGWFTTGATLLFKNNDDLTSIHFWGCNCVPEVFYKGRFYYVHEAWGLGLFNKYNPSILYGGTKITFDNLTGEMGVMKGYNVEFYSEN